VTHSLVTGVIRFSSSLDPAAVRVGKKSAGAGFLSDPTVAVSCMGRNVTALGLSSVPEHQTISTASCRSPATLWTLPTCAGPVAMWRPFVERLQGDRPSYTCGIRSSFDVLHRTEALVRAIGSARS